MVIEITIETLDEYRRFGGLRETLERNMYLYSSKKNANKLSI